MTKPVRRHSPEGCNCPVLTHLTANERQDVEARAASEMRSLSSTVRVLMLRGMAQSPSPATAASPSVQ